MTGRVSVLWALVLAGAAARAAGQDYPPPSTWVPAGTLAPVTTPPTAAPGGPFGNPDVPFVPAPAPAPYFSYPAAPAVPVFPPPRALPLASAADGVYLDFELFISNPSVTIQRSEPNVDFGHLPPLRLPRAQPDTYVSPLFEFGYRFAGGTPYLAVNYRYVGSDGREDRVNAAGEPFLLTSQLRTHAFGFDVGGGTAPPPTDLALWAARWSFGWRLGVQVANVTFGTQVRRDSFSSSIDNDYWAAGPHGRLSLERRFGFAPELSWFGRVDGSLLVGEGTRTSRVEFVGDLGNPRQRQLSYSMVKPAPVLQLVTGLGYRPEALPELLLSVGYVYEHWWSMGLVTSADGISVGTKGQTTSHGLFLQLRYDF